MQKILLTKNGFLKLKKEVNILEQAKIKKIQNDLSQASRDNELDSEYNSVIDDLLLIEGRLEKIKTTLRYSKIVDFFFDKFDRKKINLGAKVEIVMDGVQTMFEIVDIVNVDPNSGKISTESPIGKALIGKNEGETLFIPPPVEKRVKIQKVVYS